MRLSIAGCRDDDGDGAGLSQALGTMRSRIREAVEWKVELHLAAHAVTVSEDGFSTAITLMTNAIDELDGADRSQSLMRRLPIRRCNAPRRCSAAS